MQGTSDQRRALRTRRRVAGRYNERRGVYEEDKGEGRERERGEGRGDEAKGEGGREGLCALRGGV